VLRLARQFGATIPRLNEKCSIAVGARAGPLHGDRSLPSVMIASFILWNRRAGTRIDLFAADGEAVLFMRSERRLSGLDWQVSQIIAVQLQEIEGVEHRDLDGATATACGCTAARRSIGRRGSAKPMPKSERALPIWVAQRLYSDD
jgi:hypothetical protein